MYKSVITGTNKKRFMKDKLSKSKLNEDATKLSTGSMVTVSSSQSF
ncbi:hypothetical protein NC99_34600 [Sunxiuqinia dokdonensis]|uniref:Uncharacterized protein n=1 Tax=Sunxiuqinia dokdonensis TaxID=1409788 RepID=A0A0L8V5J1_9BACT|nr:hypothetical protein NC99_34600 [Sunxiuqinia dokdonensis]